MRGRLQIETVSSPVLADNPLGDPRRRSIPVYLPPSLCRGAKRRYPVLYYLPGFLGGGCSAVSTRLWRENVAERLDRLIALGKAREAILVIPDCSTAYGGSQYLNSSATGRYEDHVVGELVPFVDDKFPTVRSAAGRALIGSSSGGFAALTLAMRHPGIFAHCACHSGDMLFEVCYGADFPKLVGELDAHGGSLKRWLKAFRASRDKAGFSYAAINAVAMSACYSPNPRSPSGFELPCDPRTAQLLPRIWARWKALDPIEAAPRRRAALKSLRTLFFDAGRRDEFSLHLGARALACRLRALGVPHRHEEHGLGHLDLAARLERSLPLLTERLER
ncbi:MAG: esterase [Elusimicrobia bacterium]|nr:esterase [Elusimicrobiota bacterium]MDE2424525.1 esterase [Elusimicrobiota bacterium]